MCVCVCVCVRACVRACARARACGVYVCQCVCVGACVRACVRVYVSVLITEFIYKFTLLLGITSLHVANRAGYVTSMGLVHYIA